MGLTYQNITLIINFLNCAKPSPNFLYVYAWINLIKFKATIYFACLFTLSYISILYYLHTGGLKRPIKKKFDPRSGILHIVGDP